MQRSQYKRERSSTWVNNYLLDDFQCQNSLYEGFFFTDSLARNSSRITQSFNVENNLFLGSTIDNRKKSITIDFTNQQLLQCPALVEMKHLSPALLKVLHYGPTDGSKTGNEEVLSFTHGLPDQSWPDPDPSDPLSVVDQVSPPLILG